MNFLVILRPGTPFIPNQRGNANQEIEFAFLHRKGGLGEFHVRSASLLVRQKADLAPGNRACLNQARQAAEERRNRVGLP